MENGTINPYTKDSMYEAFILRANREYDNSATGAHGSVIQNLIRAEEGDTTFVKYHGSFEQQFKNAQDYICEALNKLLAMKSLPNENVEALKVLKSELDVSSSSDDLMKIIEEALELTQLAKDYEL